MWSSGDVVGVTTCKKQKNLPRHRDMFIHNGSRKKKVSKVLLVRVDL